MHLKSAFTHNGNTLKSFYTFGYSLLGHTAETQFSSSVTQKPHLAKSVLSSHKNKYNPILSTPEKKIKFNDINFAKEKKNLLLKIIDKSHLYQMNCMVVI